MEEMFQTGTSMNLNSTYFFKCVLSGLCAHFIFRRAPKKNMQVAYIHVSNMFKLLPAGVAALKHNAPSQFASKTPSNAIGSCLQVINFGLRTFWICSMTRSLTIPVTWAKSSNFIKCATTSSFLKSFFVKSNSVKVK